jgi:hypothetical protein
MQSKADCVVTPREEKEMKVERRRFKKRTFYKEKTKFRE